MKNYLKIFRKGSKSFYFASLFLPKELREDSAYLYYLCRKADDIADTNSTISKEHAARKLQDIYEDPKNQHFFREKDIELKYFRDLLTGVASDLDFKQPHNFEQLYHYSYQVAGTVGVMVSQLFGIKDKMVLKHAQYLGIAMQLTNILRDIKEDSLNDRIYIPKDDLKKFNVNITDIYEQKLSKELQALIREYIETTRKLYIEGNKGIEYLPQKTQTAIKIASKVYEGILDEIEDNGYNPFVKRVYVNVFKKVKIAFDVFKNGRKK